MNEGGRAIYLLHFDQKYGRVQHYLGSAFIERLPARWAEHAGARGSSLTAALARAGIGFTAFILDTQVPSSREKTLKARGRLWRHCPICCEQELLAATGVHYVPSAAAQAPVFEASEAWKPYD